MKSPLDTFFALGDKVTRGDPKKKADFDYYMLWIIFLAFFTILVSNIYEFFQTQRFSSLGWAVVMVGILWFQYGGLKQFYGMRKMMKENANKPKEPMKVESVDEMMKGFDK